MEKLVFVGLGIANAFAIVELLNRGYDGKYITVIEKGNSAHNRKPHEVMEGTLGAGGFSDHKRGAGDHSCPRGPVVRFSFGIPRRRPGMGRRCRKDYG